MKLRAAACLALVLMAGAPALAQDAQAKPDRAPGVQVDRVTKLMVGDRAPELAIGEWVKGDEITGFEEGRVYVVEFWATWCGPCIAGMPHVSEMQKEYKDKGVTVLGVNIWDDPANVAPFMKHRERNGEVQPSGDELMQYTVAIEKKIEGEEIRYGEMANNWMKAAGRNGIPCAFIVDQNGYVAWIGHPMRMDKPLEQVVAGEWDLGDAAKAFAKESKQAAEQQAKAGKVSKLLAPYSKAFAAGKHEEAYKALAEAIEADELWSDANTLNSLAWRMVDPEAKLENRGTKLAVKIAERASELTDNEDPMILDTLAWAYYHAGAKDKAVKTETKAYELASGDLKAELKQNIEKMKD